MKNQFTIGDETTALDLMNFLQRAQRMDANGFTKLRAYGDVLAAYVSPIYSTGLNDSSPTVIGMRTMPLAGEFEVDGTVTIKAVLGQLEAGLADGFAEPIVITLPPYEHVAWAGITPPRSGWHQVGVMDERDLTDVARRGIAEVAESLPPQVGGPLAAKIRGSIWGRSIDLTTKLPAGAALAAAGLGFLTEGEQVPVFHSDNWVRLSSAHGHVLTRQSNLY
jgi:hypothetical protein